MTTSDPAAFDNTVLTPNPSVRGPILRILSAALTAADPAAAVQTALAVDGATLRVGEKRYDLDSFERIFVLGAGKAGAPMAQAVEAVLGHGVRDGRVTGGLVTGGLVVVKTDHGGPTERIPIVEATHPVPNEAGVAAGQRILAMAAQATERDLVIALISGGGSALLTAPAEGVSLADLQSMNRALLACGASIDQINTLRKHVSGVKGGQLAQAVAPATLITLVLSDVVGSPLDVIASGPTVPDPTTWADAWAVVEAYNLQSKLAPPILSRLRAGLDGQIADTPKPDAPLFQKTQTAIVADNRLAALAALAEARRLGYNSLLLSTFVEGEAAQVGELLVGLGKEIQASGHPVPAPACLILGGETTVTLGKNPGHGGRNQELALAAALALNGTTGITVASLATDGTDGPTDSAGGLVDGSTVARGTAQGMDAASFLHAHDAYPFLQAVDDLLRTGPTRTNVNDLMFVIVQ